MIKLKAYGICLYKKESNTIKLLLCKSIASQNNWGFLKGIQEKDELKIDTAIREFYEEGGIQVQKKHLENYFEQKNQLKDIGIFLVNYDTIDNIKKNFNGDKLLSKFLSWENSQVKFFDISDLPPIKKKQQQLTRDIVQYFKKER